MRKFLKTDGFHRSLEGWPLTFTILTTIAILIGGLVQFLPLVLVDENIPRIESVTPWTPLELAGRDIYIKEGCNNCHSQAVRPFRHELERYGEYQKAGETIYERPFLWGSKRTGPDLLRVGGKYSHLWHVRHMEDPRSTSPNSVMPPYPWLLRKDARLDNLPAKLRALARLGTPYSEDEIANAETIAREQAAEIARDIVQQGGPEGLESKEIVALVAYLQRLGTDVSQQRQPLAADSDQFAPNEPSPEMP